MVSHGPSASWALCPLAKFLLFHYVSGRLPALQPYPRLLNHRRDCQKPPLSLMRTQSGPSFKYLPLKVENTADRIEMYTRVSLQVLQRCLFLWSRLYVKPCVKAPRLCGRKWAIDRAGVRFPCCCHSPLRHAEPRIDFINHSSRTASRLSRPLMT